VWKTFEESHGTADDIAKVQGMMPVVSKRRHVDQETGQTVEGAERTKTFFFVTKLYYRLGNGIRG
jgi:hypothetical protein